MDEYSEYSFTINDEYEEYSFNITELPGFSSVDGNDTNDGSVRPDTFAILTTQHIAPTLSTTLKTSTENLDLPSNPDEIENEKLLGVLLPVVCSFTALLFLLGFVGNGILFTDFLCKRDDSKRTTQNGIVFQLSISNLFLVIGFPLFLVGKLVVFDNVAVGVVCEILLYIHFLSSLGLQMQHVFLGCHIYTSTKNECKFNGKVSRYMAPMIWIASVIVAAFCLGFYGRINRFKGISIFFVVLFLLSFIAVLIGAFSGYSKKHVTNTKTSKARLGHEKNIRLYGNQFPIVFSLGLFTLCWVVFLSTFAASAYGVYNCEIAFGVLDKVPLIGLGFVCFNAAVGPFIQVVFGEKKSREGSVRSSKELICNENKPSVISNQYTLNQNKNVSGV